MFQSLWSALQFPIKHLYQPLYSLGDAWIKLAKFTLQLLYSVFTFQLESDLYCVSAPRLNKTCQQTQTYLSHREGLTAVCQTIRLWSSPVIGLPQDLIEFLVFLTLGELQFEASMR